MKRRSFLAGFAALFTAPIAKAKPLNPADYWQNGMVKALPRITPAFGSGELDPTAAILRDYSQIDAALVGEPVTFTVDYWRENLVQPLSKFYGGKQITHDWPPRDASGNRIWPSRDANA